MLLSVKDTCNKFKVNTQHLRESSSVEVKICFRLRQNIISKQTDEHLICYILTATLYTFL